MRDMKKAFTLVELMIVVAILGILAAIVIPEFQSHSEQASESAAKETLRTIRQQIEYFQNLIFQRQIRDIDKIYTRMILIGTYDLGCEFL